MTRTLAALLAGLALALACGKYGPPERPPAPPAEPGTGQGEPAQEEGQE